MSDPIPLDASADDHWLAAELAEAAGNLLIGLRDALVAEGADPVVLGRQGDRQAHELIMRGLAERAPLDPVLSEEGRADAARLGARRVWIVDPLDGTREFSEPPRTDWAVHVALVVDRVPRAGAVALPAEAATLSTADPPAVLPPVSHRPRVVVSRTRPPALAAPLAEALGAELLTMGSAGAKTAAVVRGAADVYVHDGGQHEWDSAAPVAVALSAGLHASRLDGSTLAYNNADPWLPDLVVCRPELADPVLSFVRRWG